MGGAVRRKQSTASLSLAEYPDAMPWKLGRSVWRKFRQLPDLRVKGVNKSSKDTGRPVSSQQEVADEVTWRAPATLSTSPGFGRGILLGAINLGDRLGVPAST